MLITLFQWLTTYL